MIESRCVYDTKYINMEYNEEVTLTNIIGYIKIKSQLYGLNEKMDYRMKKASRFSEKVKLSMKS